MHGKLFKGIGFPIDSLSVANVPLKRGQEGRLRYETEHEERLRKAVGQVRE
jgi:hypothetical protein